MKKKLYQYAAAAAAAMSILFAAACGGTSAGTGTTAPAYTQEAAASGEASENTQPEAIEVTTLEDAFSDSDVKDVTAETADAVITLSGSEGTISDTTRGSSGSTVTISSKGIYTVTGSSEDVTILVNDETESGTIYLVLDNVSMTNSAAPCIEVDAADKVVIQCLGENTLTYNGPESAKLDGAVYAKDDLSVNGSGTLTITSTLHGIVAKNDLKVTGAKIAIEAAKIGIQAGDSVRIGGGETTIVSGHDGVQLENDEGTSYFYMEDGSLTIDAGYDGIDVDTSGTAFSGNITFAGGSADITAGGGAENAKTSTSQKGLKCAGDIYVGNAGLTISSADDAFHSGTNVYISDGVTQVSSSDDGVHADAVLAISGGTLVVSKSYEGLEAETVSISGGDVSVYASDDGINAAGGSDTSSSGDDRWNSASTGALYISGGTVYVNSGGDGLDSNGSIYVSGGVTFVEGPTNSGNGALDKGDGSGSVLSITGGTVVAAGSAGMAVNFDSGSQCSALVTLSGSAGDVISADDGSGVSFTATKSFQTVVYSSPGLQQGSSYTLSAGADSATMDFTSSLYYGNAQGMGNMGGHGGMNNFGK